MSSNDTDSSAPKKRFGGQLLFLALAAGIGAATSIAVSKSGYTISSSCQRGRYEVSDRRNGCAVQNRLAGGRARTH